MKKIALHRHILFRLVILTLAWNGFVPASFAEQPFSSWLMMDWSQRLDYGLEPRLGIENRLSDANPNWQQIELTPELVWHYSPRYDFSLGYMMTYQDLQTPLPGEMTDGTSDTAHQATASATVFFPIQDFQLQSRQRIEYGVDQQQTMGDFRQLNRLDYNGQLLPFHLKPFISNEWFVDLERGYLDESRTILGLSYQITPHHSVEIYGMRRDLWSERGYSDTGHVFGVNFMLNF